MPTYNFGGGRPSRETFPVEGLIASAVSAITHIGGEFVAYPDGKGYIGLREVAAARFAAKEGRTPSIDTIAITNGSMQAVTLMADTFAGTGEVIITEELTYSGTISAYRRRQAELLGIPLDQDGMRIDALGDALHTLVLKGRKPAFIYTIVNYQNPTGVVMSLDRRKALVDIAEHYDILIVEDNCYGDVDFEENRIPSLYTLAPPGRVVHIASLSKILGAGLRLGYFIAPEPLYDMILACKDDAGTSMLSASIVAEYLKSHLWKHVSHANALLKRKRDAVFEGLEETVGDLCTWSRPTGGLFIWVELPGTTDMRRLQEFANTDGVIYAEGRAFSVRDEELLAIRLAFGYPTLEEIRGGIRLLGRAIQKAC